MIRRHTVLVIMILVASSNPANAETGSLGCAAELDAVVALASNNDYNPSILDSRFAALETACPAFAQLTHNRGVLAARDNRWPQAIAHFERALNKDSRAADTHRHLQQIFEYRAAQAYSKALDTELQAQPPTLEFQNSADLNSDSAQTYPEHERLRDIATVEYELFAWWHAQGEQTIRQHHYVDGYTPQSVLSARQNVAAGSWQDTRREIAFTKNDVVVIISDATDSKTLLLMRLVGNRWKIYQETVL